MKVIKYTLLFSSFFLVNLNARMAPTVFTEKRLLFNPQQLPPKTIEVQPGTVIIIYRSNIPTLEPQKDIPYQSMKDEGFKITNFINFNEKMGRMDNVGRYYKIYLYQPQKITFNFWSLRGGTRKTTIIVKNKKGKQNEQY